MPTCPLGNHRPTIAAALTVLVAAATVQAGDSPTALRLCEYVGHSWTDELIHYPVAAAAGAFPGGTARLLDAAGQEVPAQLGDVALHDAVVRAHV